jgi:ribosome maturation factor RimP
MTSRERQLERVLGPTIEALGCRIWGVELLSQGKHSLLRIYIDRDDGVSIDDCERVSKQVSAVLDVEDPITSSYTLEVSSPGLDRLLFKPEHYAQSVGERVDLRLGIPEQGRRRVIGEMTRYAGGELTVDVDGTPFVVQLTNVQRARIVPRFDR